MSRQKVENRANWLLRKSGRVCWKLAKNSKPYSSFPRSQSKKTVFSSNVFLDFQVQISETKRRTLEYPRPRVESGLGKRSTSATDVDWFICQDGS